MTEEERNAFHSALADSEYVLVGIGGEWKKEKRSEIRTAYEKLSRLLGDKDYFIVTTVEDGEIGSSQLDQTRIAAPYARETNPTAGGEERWQSYMNWLMNTVNRNLLILELGEGFLHPGVIRWPFEQTVSLNRKSQLYRIHEKYPQIPDNLDGRGHAVRENSVDWILGGSWEK